MTKTEILAAVRTNHNRTDRDTIAETGLALALTELVKQYEFRSTKQILDVTISAEDGHVDLPTNWLSIYEVRFMNGLLSYPLEFTDRERALKKFPDADTLAASRPELCYLEGSSVYFVPRTSIDAGVRLTYSITPSFPSSGNIDPPILGLDLFFIAYATAWVFMTLQMFKEASAWMGQANAALMSAIQSDQTQPADDHIKQPICTVPTFVNDPTDPFMGLNQWSAYGT